MRHYLLLIALFGGVSKAHAAFGFSKEKKPVLTETPSCDVGYPSNSVTARYLQGKGVGFNTSYTTVELFLSPTLCDATWSPFLDVAGHILNNGRWALNTGVGMRHVDTYTYGLNLYYDFRTTNHFSFNQIGVGYEVIGPIWSLSINGYAPISRRISPNFSIETQSSDSGTNFAFFEGNQIFLNSSSSSTTTAKRQYAFSGGDINFMVRACDMNKGTFALDFGLGPYYFHSYFSQNAVGGKASFTARFKNYASLSIGGSYDTVFRGRLDGTFAISVPFGGKSFTKCRNNRCAIPSFWNLKLAEGANRNEMIVLDSKRITIAATSASETTVAIDPLTGQPYTIWFVNNTSNSLGTFESPFPLLADAEAISLPHDLIYIYPGDGSSYTGITLKDYQQLLGSSTTFTLPTTEGLITIPAQTSILPLLTNTGSTDVTLANSNRILGLHLGDSTLGISGNNIQNTTIVQNQIVSDDRAIELLGYDGSIAINQNQIVGSQTGIYLSSSSASVTTVTENSFTNYTVNGARFEALSGSTQTLTATSNSFTAPPGATASNAIFITATDSIGNVSLNSNLFTQNQTNDVTIFANGTTNLTASVTGNSFISDPSFTNSTGLSCRAEDTTNLDLLTSNNNFTNHTAPDLAFLSTDDTTATVNIFKNSFQGALSSGSTKGVDITFDTNAIGTTTVYNNTFVDHKAAAITVSIQGVALLQTTIASNTMTSAPLGGANDGIRLSVNSSNTNPLHFDVVSNVIKNYGLLINMFCDQYSNFFSNIAGNSLQGVLGDSFKGLSFTSNGTSFSTLTITNNTCQNFTQADLYTNARTNSHIVATASRNTTIGSPGSLSPYGIQFDADDTGVITNTISNNYSIGHTDGEIALSSRGSNSTIATTITENVTSSEGLNITLVASNNSSITQAIVTNNRCLDGLGGINVEAQGNSSIPDYLVSNNLVNITNPMGGGIRPGTTGPTATIGATRGIIENNTLTNIAGFAINISSNSSNPLYASILNNTMQLSRDSVSGFGLFMLPTSSGRTFVTFDSNTITGESSGSSIGMAIVNASSICQDPLITNNTVSNVLTSMPPLPGLGGGIVVVIPNTGDLRPTFENNRLQNNAPLDFLATTDLGGGGDMCLTLSNNQSDTGYFLQNNSGFPSQFTYNDAGGNIGTIFFDPDQTQFTPGTCTSCP